MSEPNLCRKHLVLVLVAVSLCPAVTHAEGAQPPAPDNAISTADAGGPIAVYRTYIEAVKRDDLVAAKGCHAIANPQDEAAVELAVGLWVSHHRFRKIVTARFGNRESPYLRDDCSDEALDRTLSRLERSASTAKDGTAELFIRWEEDDGVEDAVFGFTGDEPVIFRKVDGNWRIRVASPQAQETLTAPGSWGWAFRETTKLVNEASDMIESGKLRTWPEVDELLDQRTKRLERQYAEDHRDPPPGE